MVKFGGHIDALNQGDLHRLDAYLVPYDAIIEDIFQNSERFVESWQTSLELAEEEFHNGRNQVWRTIYEKISSEAEAENVRGSHPGNALKLYAENVHPDKARELLVEMNQIHQTAEANSEGLRKLVKKYDKYVGNLSSTLLPTLYTSSLYSGQEMFRNSIALLRELLEEDSGFQPMIKRDSEYRHDIIIEDRIDEIDWLKRVVSAIDQLGMLDRLVAHRGFHYLTDRNDKRPLENTLSAFEVAWTSGIQLCECDVAMTKDEKIIVAHDDNFMRLALDTKSPYSSRRISDLTFRELMGLPLKSGIRPALLIDCLRSAKAISPDAKLVIEIKPGNETAASALSRLLIRHPELCPSVAMIMSFDAVTMHRLRADLRILNEVVDSRSRQNLHNRSPSHTRVSSFDHFGTTQLSRMWESSTGLNPFDNYPSSIGLSLDDDQAEDTSTRVAIPKSTSLIPKLMLLTVSDPPKIPCEQRVNVDDFSPVEGWLKRPDGALDGVYVQWEEKMMTEEGAERLFQLSQQCLVGIWAYAGKDPDDFETYKWLVTKGNCSFVNTDLPSKFHGGVLFQKGSRGATTSL